MDSPFYNINFSYDQNWKEGPPLVNNKVTPPKRIIKKKQKFLGFDVNVPFGMPAGPLLNSNYLKTAFEWGFDVNCYKTQRSTALQCNEFPNILFVDVDGNLTLKKAEKPLLGTITTKRNKTEINITNSFGNPSYGPDIWQKDMKKALSYAGDGQLLIASVCGTLENNMTENDYYEDFAISAKLVSDTDVPVVELNLSCPNCVTEGIICYTPQAVYEICKKTKEKVGNTKIIAKIGYFSKNQQKLLETIIKKITPFISAISAINTIAAPVVDKNGKQALPGPNRLKSGICGAGIKWAGLDMVKRLARLREKLHKDYEIVGVGGVMTPSDYIEYRNAGANLVQSATGAMWNPYLAYDVWKKQINK